MIKLSFVIPVYNVELYLKECLDSILSQVGPECEVVLVDDGSRDGSGDLCDAYAEAASSVKVIHKENEGAAAARNDGLSACTGEFVAFVDADDRLASGCVAEILAWIEAGGADMCFMEAVKFYPDGSAVSLGDALLQREIRGKTKPEVCRHLVTRPKFSGSACTKIFRRAFLRENGIWFPEGRRHGEDLTFCRDCIMKAETYDMLAIPYYEYRQERTGSVSSVVNMTCFWDIHRFVAESADLLTDRRVARDSISGYIMSFAAYEYSILLMIYGFLSPEERRECFSAMKNCAWVMNFACSKRLKAVSLLAKLTGIRTAAGILRWYMNHR